MGIVLDKVEREVIELSTEGDYQDEKDDAKVPVVSADKPADLLGAL